MCVFNFFTKRLHKFWHPIKRWGLKHKLVQNFCFTLCPCTETTSGPALRSYLPPVHVFVSSRPPVDLRRRWRHRSIYVPIRPTTCLEMIANMPVLASSLFRWLSFLHFLDQRRSLQTRDPSAAMGRHEQIRMTNNFGNLLESGGETKTV